MKSSLKASVPLGSGIQLTSCNWFVCLDADKSIYVTCPLFQDLWREYSVGSLPDYLLVVVFMTPAKWEA